MTEQDPAGIGDLSRFGRPLYSPAVDGTADNPRNLPKPLERPEPTADELKDTYVAPGQDADHPIGVLYYADHETLDDGVCRQVRLHARALADTGMPLKLQSIASRVRYGPETFVAGEDMLMPEVREKVGSLRKTTIARAGIIIVQAVIWEVNTLWRLLLPTYVQREDGFSEVVLRKTIVYMPWERDTVAREMVKGLERVGQVWLQCERNIKAFVEAGLPREKIRHMPNGFDPASPVCRIAETRPRVPHGRRYYTIAKWEPRKGLVELVRAWLQTFSPGDAASLTIKTQPYGGRWDDLPSPAELVKRCLEDPDIAGRGWTKENLSRQLFIFQGLWSEADITKLHALNNIYVSASHAEGWDYPAFDARCAGNRLVHVGFGGSEDYAGPGDVRVPFELGPVHRGYGWEPHARWAVYTERALMDALRAATPPASRVFPAAELDGYTAETVGALMHDHVLELARERQPALIEYVRARHP